MDISTFSRQAPCRRSILSISISTSSSPGTVKLLSIWTLYLLVAIRMPFIFLFMTHISLETGSVKIICRFISRIAIISLAASRILLGLSLRIGSGIISALNIAWDLIQEHFESHSIGRCSLYSIITYKFPRLHIQIAYIFSASSGLSFASISISYTILFHLSFIYPIALYSSVRYYYIWSSSTVVYYYFIISWAPKRAYSLCSHCGRVSPGFIITAIILVFR